MAIENRQQEGLYATATRKDMSRVRRTEGINERSHVERADHPQHQRSVSHRTDVINRNHHETAPLQVVLELSS